MERLSFVYLIQLHTHGTCRWPSGEGIGPWA